MRTIYYICIGFWLFLGIPGILNAGTYQLTDGQTVAGDIVSFNESGLVVRLPEDRYSDRIPWTKFSQEDLKTFAQNPKIAPLVEPFIDLAPAPKNTPPVQVKIPARLARPKTQSLLGAMLSSSVGLFVLLAVYAANIYAALEIARFRSRPPALVCSVSAILPLAGPVLFLAMPSEHKDSEEEEEAEPVSAPPSSPAIAPARPATHPASPAAAAIASAPRSAAAPEGTRLAPAETAPIAPAASQPQTQVFQRGAFTFNRRFFETKFAAFFGVVRRDPDKNSVLVIKAARGEFAGQRITRITSNELHLQVQKGNASEEVMIPFSEIKEIQLTHNPAA